MLTATGFTIGIVGATTFNVPTWKTLSNAIDGACGSGTITLGNIPTQGTK